MKTSYSPKSSNMLIFAIVFVVSSGFAIVALNESKENARSRAKSRYL